MALVRSGTPLLAVLLLATPACRESSAPGVAGPTGLTARAMSFDEVELTWTPPSDAFDGYAIDARVGDAPFEEVVREEADPGVNGVVLTVPPEIPELVTLTFRVKAYRGSTDSRPSNEASVQRGLRPPLVSQVETGTWPDGGASGPVVVRWTTSSLVADEVQAERAELDAAGNAGPYSAVAADFAAATLEDAAVEPGKTYGYRIRNGRGGAFSEWSYVPGVHIDWPIRSATDLVAEPAQPGGARVDPITVSWRNASTLADALELARAEVLPSDALGPWTVLPAAFPATSYVDWDVVDPRSYAYRVTYSQGDLRSEPVVARSPALDLVRPRDVNVEKSGSGHLVTWRNGSTTATGVRVQRQDPGLGAGWTPFADLAPDAVAYEDATALLWPGTRYRVTAFKGDLAAPSAEVAIPPPAIDTPVPLVGALAPLGAGYFVVMDSTGRFHAGYGDAISRPVEGGWDVHAAPGPNAFVPPYVRVDALDHPHAVGVELTQLDPVRIWTMTHHWHDGVGWRTEVAASVPGYYENAVFGVDAAGTPHVLFDAATDGLHYVHRVRTEAGWVEAPLVLQGLVDPFVLRTDFEVAPDGTAFFGQLVWERLGGTNNVPRLVLLTRPAAGAWTQEVVPAEPTTDGVGLALVPGDGGDVGVFFRSVGGRLAFVAKEGGAWGVPVELCPFGYDDRMAAAMNPSDGKVVAVLSGKLPTGEEPAFFCARASGAWGCAPLSPWPGAALVSTGFGPDGKAWVVEFLTFVTSPVAVFTEP